MAIAGQQVMVRVAAMADRFPTLGPRFAVIDGASLERRLHLIEPGTGTPNELWIAAKNRTALPTLNETLQSSRFGGVTTAIRDELRRERLSSATSRVAMAVFFAVAVGVLLIMVIGIVLAVGSTDEQEAGLLRWLLLYGRKHSSVLAFLRVRLLVAVIVGALVGLVAGVGASRLAAAALADGTTGGRSGFAVLPTLTVVNPWLVISSLSGLVCLIALAAVWRATRRALPQGDLLRGSP
jgi:predicted lysophospholipase L1 biosynthesis ABC-type transport system permease subunit